MKVINTDNVINFLNSSTNHDIAFLLTILAQRIMIFDGRNDKGVMTTIDDFEDCCLNGIMFQLNTSRANED